MLHFRHRTTFFFTSESHFAMLGARIMNNPLLILALLVGYVAAATGLFIRIVTTARQTEGPTRFKFFSSVVALIAATTVVLSLLYQTSTFLVPAAVVAIGIFVNIAIEVGMGQQHKRKPSWLITTGTASVCSACLLGAVVFCGSQSLGNREPEVVQNYPKLEELTLLPTGPQLTSAQLHTAHEYNDALMVVKRHVPRQIDEI